MPSVYEFCCWYSAYFMCKISTVSNPCPALLFILILCLKAIALLNWFLHPSYKLRPEQPWTPRSYCNKSKCIVFPHLLNSSGPLCLPPSFFCLVFVNVWQGLIGIQKSSSLTCKTIKLFKEEISSIRTVHNSFWFCLTEIVLIPRKLRIT